MFKIALVPGDGIGMEVLAEGVKVLDALSEIESINFELTPMNIGSERYLRTGELLTEEDISIMSKNQAIYFGAIGDPRVPPGVLEKGVLIAMRTRFDQYVNLRPSRSWHPYTPLKSEKDFDIIFLRENTEDFYMGAGGRLRGKEADVDLKVKRELYEMNIEVRSRSTKADDYAFEIGMMSRKGIERFADHAFNMAKSMGKQKITAVDKANVLPISMECGGRCSMKGQRPMA